MNSLHQPAGLAHDQILERQDAHQFPVRVDHEHLVEVLDLLRLPPDRLQRLLDGRGVPHGDHVARHEATGGLRVVAEEALDIGAVLHLREDPLLRFRGEIAEHVRRVVVLQLPDDLRGPLGTQRRERLLGVGPLRHFRQRLAGKLGRERLHHRDALVLVEGGEHVREIGRLEVVRLADEVGELAAADELDHALDVVVGGAHQEPSWRDTGAEAPERISSRSIRVGDA